MSFRCGISTEELLDRTPIELVRRPDIYQPRGDHRYYAVRKSDGEIVGGTRIVFWNDNTKELNDPYVYRQFLGCGYGLAIYVVANRTMHESGPCLPLQSQINFLSSSAARVWQSLVKREVAVGPSDFGQYHFVSNAI